MKRGQVTVYIIMGIILLFFLAFLAVASNRKNADVGFTQPDDQGSFYKEQCVRYSGEKAVSDLLNSGGDVYQQLPALAIDNRKATILYEEGFSYLPSIGDMENQLSSRSSEIFADCFQSREQISATMAENAVLFETEELTVEVPVGLKKMHASAGKVIEAIAKSDMSTDTKVSSFIQPYLKAEPQFNLEFAYSEMALPRGVAVRYEIYDPITTLWLIEYDGHALVFAARHMRKTL